MKKRFATKGRLPIFKAGQHHYADLLYYHGLPVEVDFVRLAEALSQLDPNRLIIGLCLESEEVRLVLQNRTLSDEESFAQLHSLTDHHRTAFGIKAPSR